MPLSRLCLALLLCLLFSSLLHAMDDAGRGLTELCERRQIDCAVDEVSNLVTLSKGPVTARALVGSDTVNIDRETIQLSAPLTRDGGRVVIPDDFEDKIISHLLKPVYDTRVAEEPLTIVLDPGHGGKDPGAAGASGIREKVVVLDIARRLREELQARGYHVIMTRESDVFLSLEERTEIASRNNADLFVSIHANSNPSSRVQGVEVYTLRDLSYQELREEQRQRNYTLLFNQLDMDPDHPEVKTILADMLYAYKRGESEPLASQVADEVSRRTRARNRGAIPSGYFVVRNTLVPSVLIEVGYLTNPREENLLRTAEYRNKIADGLARSIEDYFQK